MQPLQEILKEQKTQQTIQQGYIHLILGCMFSSKTTKLLQVMEQFERIGKRCLYVKFDNDNRYSEHYLQTHSELKSKKKAFNCHDLMILCEDSINYDVFALDEIQFYQNVVQFVELMANNNKIIIATGLSSDFQRKSFPVIMNLIPLCDKITYQRAICSLCKSKASFSFRISNSKEIIVIGNEYIPLCRSCWNSQNLQ